MRESDIVRTIRIKGETEGIDAAKTSVRGLATAMADLGKASETTGVKTETSARRQASAVAQFERLERQISPVARGLYELEKAQRLVNMAVGQNPALQERANDVMQVYAERLERARNATNKHSAATDTMTKSAGLARHELVNLSRQAQDVVVSIAGGQSLSTVLLQQGSQIGDVFASSKATVGDFARQAVGWLGQFLTLGRVAFGGVAAAVTGAGFALDSYLDKQNKVALSLTGAGRASGASVSSINSSATQGASTFGLSVSEARELASALAVTGKVANDNILPIVKMGKDIAYAFGIDAQAATKLLADAFADPVRGADALTSRLGFLDAAMQRRIERLVEMGRLEEAQRVLLSGVQNGLSGVSDSVSAATKMWTGLSNAISNAWDATGNFIARSLGIGKSLSEQYQAAVDRVKSLQGSLASDQLYADALSKSGMSAAEIDKVIPSLKVMADAVTKAQAEADSFKKKLDESANSSREIAANFESIRSKSTIFSQLTDRTQRESLQSAASLAGAVAEDPLAQRKIGITQAEADKVSAILRQLQADYKTTFETVQIGSKIALDSIIAFTPAAKALIAQRQAVEQYRQAGGLDPAEKAKIAQDAYNVSLQQSLVGIREQARERHLAAKQNLQAATTELALVGKGLQEQTQGRLDIQAPQRLEPPPQKSANDNEPRKDVAA